MSPHKKRILTSIVVLPVVGWIILCGSNFFFQVLIFLVSSLALFEFLSLFWKNNHLNFKILAVLFCFLVVFHDFIHISPEFLLISCFWILNLLFLFIYGKKNSPIPWIHIQLIFLGIIYIPYVLQFFQKVPRKDIVFILGITIVSDTCAYYSGKFFGEKKLWPRISPKKTWMGSLGSLFSCWLFSLIYGELFFSLSWYYLFFFGTILNLGAQFGDLFESAIKRHLNIKDSGFILPGHGGILDRIDSLLFVCPIYIIFTRYFININ